MRLYRVLFVVAIGLLFVSFSLLDRGFDFRTSMRGQEEFSIPGGPQWFYVVELQFQAGGGVSLEYEEVADGTLTVYLLEPDNYGEYYSTGMTTHAVSAVTGSSGSFAAQVPAEGTYYLVFAHGPGYEFVPQEVELQYLFTGLQRDATNWGLAGAGLALAVLGIGVAAYAAVSRLRLIGQGSVRSSPVDAS